MRYKIIRVIGVVLLVLGAVMIFLRLDEGKSVIHSIGAGGGLIGVGAALLGMSLRLENKEKASGNPSDTPSDERK